MNTYVSAEYTIWQRVCTTTPPSLSNTTKISTDKIIKQKKNNTIEMLDFQHFKCKH